MYGRVGPAGTNIWVEKRGRPDYTGGPPLGQLERGLYPIEQQLVSHCG